MKRVMLWVLGLVLAAVVGASVYMRTLSHPADVWHLDPVEATRSSTDNDYLVAPKGVTEARVDRTFVPREIAPKDLLFLFDSIARNSPRVERLAMDEDNMSATYVQTTALFAFPDYITVRAVTVDSRAGLVIWSRSRFGASDFGVNKERIDDWLAKIGP